MPGPDRDHPDNLVDAIKNVFDTQPETGSDGIGPTLGQDVGKPNNGAPAPADRDSADEQQ